MKLNLLKLFAIGAITLTVILGSFLFHDKFKILFVSNEDIEVKTERVIPSETRQFGYFVSKGQADWDEAPDKINKISMDTKLIKDFKEEADSKYFLAYHYNVELAPQKMKLSNKYLQFFTEAKRQDYTDEEILDFISDKLSENEEKITKAKNAGYSATEILDSLNKMLIIGYCIEFDFYLLDQNGYCLMQINSQNTEKQTSPNPNYWIMIEKDAKGHGQIIIKDILIPEIIAKRTKKIAYWPKFCAAAWRPIENVLG